MIAAKGIMHKNPDGDITIDVEILYKKYRNEFVQWLGKKYKCTEEDAKEVFQISVITFYENVVSGKLETLTSSEKTYLFGIGRNKYFEMTRTQNRFVFDWDFRESGLVDGDDEAELLEEKIKHVTGNLERLGEQCRALLVLYYYKKLNLSQIAGKLGYKNTDTVKTMKYRCMNKLRSICFQKSE